MAFLTFSIARMWEYKYLSTREYQFLYLLTLLLCKIVMNDNNNMLLMITVLLPAVIYHLANILLRAPD